MSTTGPERSVCSSSEALRTPGDAIFAVSEGDLSRVREKEAAVARTVLYEEVRRLLDDGAQFIEVLPEAEYSELHLAGARNIPLKRLDAATTADLDRARPVVVYCHDAL